MLIKSRTESEELHILNSLNARMDLSPRDKQKFVNLKRGFEGETKFDLLTANLHNKYLVLNDLLLESNHSIFQIDSLFITQELLLPFEIKYYEGDFYYENDAFYKCSTKREITNPLHQLNRVEVLLRQFLQNHKYHIPIKGGLVFNHPEFFLYNAPQNEKITFTPQLNTFLNKLSTYPSKLNERHHELAKHLLDAHLMEPPFSNVPPYQYEHLRKGILCKNCCTFMSYYTQRRVICKQCGQPERIESAVVRSTNEFRFLFPDKKITTEQIFDWCKIENKRMIGRILRENFNVLGYGQWTTYE